MTILLLVLLLEENSSTTLKWQKIKIKKINRYKEFNIDLPSILKGLEGAQQGGGFPYHHFLSTLLLFSNAYLLSELG